MCCWFLRIVFYDLWRSRFFFFQGKYSKVCTDRFPQVLQNPTFWSALGSRGPVLLQSSEPWDQMAVVMVWWYQNTSNASQATKLPFHFTLLSKLDQLEKYIFSKRLVFLINYPKAAISFSDSIFKRAVPDVSLWCRVPVLAYSVGTDWLEGKGDPWHCYIANEHSVWTKLCFFSGLMSFLLQVARLMEMGFSRGDALEALRASNNDLNVATNFLLQHWWFSVRRNSPRGVCTRLKEDQSHLLDRLTKVGPASSVRKKRLALRDRWLKAMLMNDVKCSQAFKSIGGFCPGYPCQNNFSFSLLLDIT